jgi:molybdate transport system ATP-binding protein
MRIGITVRHRLELITIDVSLTIGDGFTALLGPSGAGKTTLLNVIAGLVRADHAVITIGDTILADTTRGIWQPAHARHVGYVFQESRLFPHLSVRQNLVYGRWVRRQREDAARFDEIVTLLDLSPLLTRPPARLSGGETRRVALGRALLSAPRLLLLDEPLGSVDVDRRQEILPYLDRVMAEHRLPVIYVTHERAEIEGRAETVVQLDGGRTAH